MSKRRNKPRGKILLPKAKATILLPPAEATNCAEYLRQLEAKAKKPNEHKAESRYRHTIIVIRCKRGKRGK